ncbi:hypothetical protein Hdeb2414_s0014g00427661 [Helianthus debilis subsp. tardiflorus]
MIFRGKEDVATETIQTPFLEAWYQDMKDVPSIDLPEKALVGAGMSLFWRMDREDKPIYMEDDRGKIWSFLTFFSFAHVFLFVVVSLYVIAFEREGGKMATVPKRADKELWYLQIVKNFVLPQDEDLAAQPTTGAGELSNLGIGPEKKKRAPAATFASKKNDAAKAQLSRAKNVKEEKKGTRHSSDSWCDYVVVSDSLEGLATVVVRKPKAEPRDSADVPVSTPDDPIDLESSPERLLKTRAEKRKQAEVETEAHSAKMVQRRKISGRGNLDAFIANLLQKNN